MVFSEVLAYFFQYDVYFCYIINIYGSLDEFKSIPKRIYPFGLFPNEQMAILGQKSAFRTVSQNLDVGSSWFCMFNCILGLFMK